MTEQTLLERTQSIHKEDFKFGTDSYMWITKVDLRLESKASHFG